MSGFVDRGEEIKSLNESYQNLSKKSALVVVYGRRRIGKTELLRNFLAGKEGVYLLATLQPIAQNIANFSQRAAEFFHDDAIKTNPFTTWDGFFQYLVRELRRRNRPTVIIFDEFTYLVQEDRAVPSIFQKYWDEHLKDLPVMFILCGSFIGMMETEVLGYKASLYGRRAKQLYVEEVPFRELAKFLPKYSSAQLVEAYSLVGGMPYYLLQLSEEGSIGENILRFTKKDSILYNDAHWVLREELREPRIYYSILRAIAAGKTTQNEIAQSCYLKTNEVGPYLATLADMKLIERRIPATEPKPERSRHGSFRIRSNYYRFWFRFIYENQDFIEQNRQVELVDEIIIPQVNTYVGPIYEDVVRETLTTMNKKGLLPFKFDIIGSWWSRKEEIDVVTVNDHAKSIVFGEVKWAALNEREVLDIRKELIRKSKLVEWNRDARIEHYLVVAKAAPKVKLEDTTVLSLDDLLGAPEGR